MPHPMKKRGAKTCRKNENRLVTFSTLLPISSSGSSLNAAIASSLTTSPTMLANTSVGYLGIEPNRGRNQSQQDFANAS